MYKFNLNLYLEPITRTEQIEKAKKYIGLLKAIKDSGFAYENEVDNEIKRINAEITHVINLNNETDVNVYLSVKNFIDNPENKKFLTEYVLEEGKVVVKEWFNPVPKIIHYTIPEFYEQIVLKNRNIDSDSIFIGQMKVY